MFLAKYLSEFWSTYSLVDIWRRRHPRSRVSDLDFVSLCFDFKDLTPWGPGVWKKSNSLLEDDDFCQYISARISDLASCKASFDSVKSWWDFFQILP